jgi:hypothetical protein
MRPIATILFWAVSAVLASGDCIPFTEAKDHIGEIHCVSGKVTRVERSDRGAHFLDFCEDYLAVSIHRGLCSHAT